MSIAIVDVGSNAVKYKIFINNNYLKPDEYIRKPLRLGKDVFSSGTLSNKSINELVSILVEFKERFKQKKISKVFYMATSAMRDTKNNKEIVNLLNENGIELEIISASDEAYLLHNFSSHERCYAVVDIGGGSVEILISQDGHKFSKSFKLGGVRLLNMSKVERKRLINDKLSWLNQFNSIEAMYGLGGNLRTIFEVNAISKTTKYKDFKRLVKNYNNLSKKKLIEKFRIPPDRIDIIPIAAEIYLCVAEKLRVDIIHSSFWSISNGMAIKKSII